jgi:uncharacterized RDD family membrane protein YckC
MKIKKTVRLSLTALGLLLCIPLTANSQDPDTADATASNKIRIHHNALVSIGKDVELKAGDTAEAVVVIGGSAKVFGDVKEAVVVIGGDADVEGDVGDNVVAVMGDVHLGPRANVRHDLVAVGGKATLADGATVGGQAQEVGLGGGPGRFLRLVWLRNWVRYCALELRPLSLQLGWVWWVAGTLFLVYLLIAVLFPHPVQCCVNQLTARPATTLAAGILVKLAMPFVFLLLAFTVIGMFVIPFVIAAAFLGLLVGKVALLEYLGGKLGGAIGPRGQAPLLAFLLGAILVTMLYLIPVIGFLTLLGVSLWGFGAAATTVFVALRRERPNLPPASVPSPGFVPPGPGFVAPGPGESFSPPPAPSSAGSTITTALPAVTLPRALAFPRAGFWERMSAGFLDVVLVCLTTPILGPFALFVGIAYFSGMWAWKGTTVGGIVLNLQVVREDGLPLNFLTAFVRSLAAIFSVLVLFLGFFWIGWDGQKQGWHDKIAGTVVVRLPKAISLVCL